MGESDDGTDNKAGHVAATATGQLTWVIENFSKVKQPKIFSPNFQAGPHSWRILVHPTGNNVSQLSVYLDVADSATLPQGWSRRAHFTLTIHNQVDPSRSVIKDADHTFSMSACDWGFCACLPLRELRDPKSGFILDGNVMVSAKVDLLPQEAALHKALKARLQQADAAAAQRLGALKAAAAQLQQEQQQRKALEARLQQAEAAAAQLRQEQQQRKALEARLQQAEAAQQQVQQLRVTPAALAACDLPELATLERTAQEGLAAIQAALQAKREANLRASPIWNALTDNVVADEAAVRAFFERRQARATSDERLRIASIVKVENQHTLGQFDRAGSFHIKPLEAHQRGDTLLFHGCPASVGLNIQASGLLLSHARNGMLGKGLYGAPDPRKSLKYSTSPDKFMFICRFNLSGAQHAGPSTPHRNSVYDEFCVYDERHVVVLWMLKLA